MLVDAMVEQVPVLIDEQLEGLEPKMSTTALELDVSMEAGFDSIQVDRYGLAATLDLDLQITGEGDGDHLYVGVLSADTTESPQLDTGSDITITMSDDLLNRGMFDVWQAGALDIVLSSEDGSLDPAILMMLHADTGTIRVNPRLPPVVVEQDNGFQLQIAELEVQIETPGGEQGELLLVAAHATADIDIEMVDGLLTPTFSDFSTVLAVRDSDWGASAEAITAILESSLPMNMMLAALSDLGFELPAFAGVGIDSVDMERDNSGFHTNIRVELAVD
jgi:hypothetical protein